MFSSRTARYALFALVYFAEGAILSYFTALNSLYLLSFNLSMSQVGLIGTIALIPFVLKIFLGMLSDRVNLLGCGYRKPYIVIGLLVQFACLVMVPSVHPGQQFGIFALLAFVLMSGQALYDTCTDGLALDTTTKEEEGTVQGIMVGGRALGVVLISALLGWVVQNLSWNGAFYLLAGMTLLPLPLVLRVQEPLRPAGVRFEWRAFRTFMRWPIIALGLLGALYSLVINAANEIVNPFLQATFQIDYIAAGLFTTVWGIGVALGGLSGGWLVDRIGQRRALLGAVAAALITVQALGYAPSLTLAGVLVCIFGIAFGYYETVYFAVSMDVTDPRIAASMFAILMAVANVGTGIGLGLSGALVDAAGYQWTFGIMAGLSLLALPLVPAVFQKRRSK